MLAAPATAAGGEDRPTVEVPALLLADAPHDRVGLVLPLDAEDAAGRPEVGCVADADVAREPEVHGQNAAALERHLEMRDPTPIRVEVPGQAGKQTYWYVLYTVTNRTGADQTFVPEFTLYTDTGQVIQAGQNVSPSVYQAIVQRHNNPLLEPSTAIAGRLLQGEDNARDGVAIFTDIDPDARVFDLFVGGLSGERAVDTLPVPITVQRVNPQTGEFEEVQTRQIVLHKTRQVTYRLAGEAAARATSQAERIADGWVMR